VERYNT
jgi:hypothetical protein